ncbi:alpha-ketoglutarate-dependent dioxygenase [Acrasis kona]|uniref:Alpha-ketoglutarate-dependent dioxygenase n=1 Tax=Acrasis kona TaxID=1008807 RepID=A0AAW2YX69_9EUKA
MLKQTSLNKFFKKRDFVEEGVVDVDVESPKKKIRQDVDGFEFNRCNLKNYKSFVENGLDVDYFERFLPKSYCNILYEFCLNHLVWYKHAYYDRNKQQYLPYARFQTHFDLNSPQFPDGLESTLKIIKEATNAEYNFVLLNLYIDGSDHIGYHSDKEVDENSAIASLSIGGAREFLLRRIEDHKDKKTFFLGNGDLLIMKGTTQSAWQHSVPARSLNKLHHPRINFTFRSMTTDAYGRRNGPDSEPFMFKNNKMVSIATDNGTSQ